MPTSFTHLVSRYHIYSDIRLCFFFSKKKNPKNLDLSSLEMDLDVWDCFEGENPIL